MKDTCATFLFEGGGKIKVNMAPTADPFGRLGPGAVFQASGRALGPDSGPVFGTGFRSRI